MAKPVKTEILLESGTNEIEIMEFTIGGNTFGINVAKVDEIMLPAPVKPMPLSHPAIEGVFKPRDVVITVVDLPKYLNLDSITPEKTLFILTNFNRMNIAFRVHTVVDIDRISWTAIEKPDKTIYGGQEGVATGIAQYDGRLITILDFEKIVADISPSTSIQPHEVDKYADRDKNNSPIVIAEDSALLSKMIVDCLHKAGYLNVVKFDNGAEAWDFLQSLRHTPDLRSRVSVLITDIEMPKMDGHRLTKLVKEDDVLKHIPVVIFSSLINEEMYLKGKELGANEQLSKPEIGRLIEIVDSFINV